LVRHARLGEGEVKDTSRKTEIISALVGEFAKFIKPKKILHLQLSVFRNLSDGVFCTNDLRHADTCRHASDIPLKKKYDLVLGDLPLNLSRGTYEKDGVKIEFQSNWIELLKGLERLSLKGIGLFILEPRAFGSKQGEKFETILNNFGFYVQGVLDAPPRILEPDTSITPVILIIGREKREHLFAAELLDVGQARLVAENFLNKKSSSTLEEGVELKHGIFSGFHKLRALQQIDRLETQYKNFEAHKLEDIAVEIVAVRSGERHKATGNSVYIPTIGTQPVIDSLDDAKIKQHNYIKVVLKSEVDAGYVAAFFRSNLGKLVLSSLYAQTFIPKINKKDLGSALVALPSEQEQSQISSSVNKLKELKEHLGEFESELALNPTSSKIILGQLDSMLDSIGELSAVDKIRELARQGESKTTEFKETLSLDVKKQKKEKYIEESALKTIVAFLNSDGGALLIGVSDDGRIDGVDAEVGKLHKKSRDNFQKHFKNLQKNQIGEEFYPFIDSELIEVDEAQVFIVRVQKSKMPCYLNKKDFYVRTNPATDKLEGPKLVNYINNHFSN
jgi:hypothetical protein